MQRHALAAMSAPFARFAPPCPKTLPAPLYLPLWTVFQGHCMTIRTVQILPIRGHKILHGTSESTLWQAEQCIFRIIQGAVPLNHFQYIVYNLNILSNIFIFLNCLMMFRCCSESLGLLLVLNLILKNYCNLFDKSHFLNIAT